MIAWETLIDVVKLDLADKCDVISMRYDPTSWRVPESRRSLQHILSSFSLSLVRQLVLSLEIHRQAESNYHIQYQHRYRGPHARQVQWRVLGLKDSRSDSVSINNLWFTS